MHTPERVAQRKRLSSTYKRFFTYKYPSHYQAEVKRLEDFYKDRTRLPDKIDKSDEDNAKFDLNRLQFICQSLEFLMKFHLADTSPITTPLDAAEKEAWAGLSLMNCRYLLEHIAFTIYHLSGELRHKYKRLLLPAPFTWETFEQLGGLMKVALPEFISHIVKSTNGLAMKHFMEEHRNTELIVEAAIQTIIDYDVPQLFKLFSYITAVELQSNPAAAPPEIKPLPLIAIKALTRRICDTESLDALLKYSDNHCHELPHDKIFKQIRKKGNSEDLYMLQVKDDDSSFAREIEVSTKLGKHAALRRLEKIGELIKGKNLSSFIKDLDPTLDWDSFIIIRDVIAHQDEHDHKAKIEALLADEKRCIQIFSIELQEFFMLLCQILVKRDEQQPKYLEDAAERFWHEVYGYEKQVLAKTADVATSATAKAFTMRTTRDNMIFFIEALKQNKAPQEIQLRWLSIFNGSGNLPNKKEYGQLLSHLPSRKDNPELYRRCKTIADQAIDDRTTPTARLDARQQQEQEAQKREQERQANFNGLTEIRRLAKELQIETDRKNLLNPVKRVDAAIEALENIKGFLENDKFIHGHYDFPTLQAWEKLQTKDHALNFFAGLLGNPQLNDALEYNAAQLLQHLDTINEYAEAKEHAYLDKIYPLLRNLRNWVEHGNDLFDKEDYDPSKEESPLSSLQKIVGPIMVRLIIELLPQLKQIKLSVAKRSASSLISSASTSMAAQAAAMLPAPSTAPQSTAPKATLFTPSNPITHHQSNTDWYTDEQVNQLLQHLINDHHEAVHFLNAMLGTNWHGSNVFQDNLTEFNRNRAVQISKGQHTPDKVVMPINLGNCHWAIVVIKYPRDIAQYPDVFYIDPLGDEINTEIATALKNCFGQDLQFITQPGLRLQHDGYNCGPWIIEIARMLIGEGRLPRENEIDIAECRIKQLAALDLIMTRDNKFCR